MARLGRRYKIDKYGFTSVNTRCTLNTNEPFVLASQCEQVFYLNDMVDKDWLVILKKNPHDLFRMPENNDNRVKDEHEEFVDEEVYQQEEVEINMLSTDAQENDFEVFLLVP